MLSRFLEDPTLTLCVVTHTSLDLHTLFIIYMNSERSRSVLDMEDILRKLFISTDVKYGFVEHYRRYSETHITPISYVYWDMQRFVATGFENGELDCLVRAMSHMGNDDRSELLSMMNDTVRSNSLDRYPVRDISLMNARLLWCLSYKDMYINLFLFLLACARYRNDIELTKVTWAILTRDESLRIFTEGVWCIYALAAGRWEVRRDIMINHSRSMIAICVNYGRLDMLMGVIGLVGPPQVDWSGVDYNISAARGGNIEMVKYVTHNLTKCLHLTRNLGGVSLPVIQLLEGELGYGVNVLQSIDSYISRGREDVVDYLMGKYDIKLLSLDGRNGNYLMISLCMKALIGGHTQLYEKFLPLVVGDNEPLNESIESCLSEMSLWDGTLACDVIFGTDPIPCIEVCMDTSDEEVIYDEACWYDECPYVKVRFTRERKDPRTTFQIWSRDEESTEILERINQYIRDTLESVGSCLHDGLSPCLDTLKRLSDGWCEKPSVQIEVLSLSSDMSCYDLFRYVLQTMPAMTDFSSIYPSLGSRFIQIVDTHRDTRG
jgi:hypothetical protein